MVRLTFKTTIGAGIWDEAKSIYPSDIYERDKQHYPAIQKALDRLAAYEDIGHDPKTLLDIAAREDNVQEALDKMEDELAAYRALGTVEELAALKEVADK